MNLLRRIFVVAALTCGAAWLIKMVAIAATGGAESDSVVVAVLWALGMVSFLVAAGTGTALLFGRAPVWARALAGLVAVPVAFALLSLLDTLVKSFYTPQGWFGDEISLVVAAIVMAALGLRGMGTGPVPGLRVPGGDPGSAGRQGTARTGR